MIAVYNNYIYAENADSAVIVCQGPRIYSSCYSNDMYLPDNTTFVCLGYGCYNLGDIYFENDENNAKWFIYGCSYCESRTECVYDLDINCNSTIYYYSGSSSSSDCSSQSSNDCDCYNMFNERTIFENDASCSIEIPPTFSPTSSPTTAPTEAPTPLGPTHLLQTVIIKYSLTELALNLVAIVIKRIYFVWI